MTPTVGLSVHFTLDDGAVVPATVVRVHETNVVNLQVLLDGEAPNVVWKRSVQYAEESKPGFWHWPPRG